MKSSRSVLIVHASSDGYGSDKACLMLAGAGQEAGWDVRVIVPGEGPLTQHLRSAAVPLTVIDPVVLRRADLRRMGVGRVGMQWIRSIRHLRRFAAVNRFDLVHSNCSVVLGGAMLARWWRVPHVWHIHELLPKGRRKQVFEQLLCTADVILTASEAASHQFSKRTRARCRVAYTGADLTAYASGAVVEDALFRHEDVQLVCVGRLNARKGQRHLIDAVRILRDWGFRVRVSIVGDVYADQHAFRDDLERHARAIGVAANVEFLGFREDALAIMANADIVVLPSAEPESFGVVLVEAMALGRPVIATAHGGPREIIRHGVDGFLVAPRSGSAIADAVRLLCEDREKARALGNAARSRALLFSSERMTQVALETWRQLADSSTVDLKVTLGVTS